MFKKIFANYYVSYEVGNVIILIEVKLVKIIFSIEIKKKIKKRVKLSSDCVHIT